MNFAVGNILKADGYRATDVAEAIAARNGVDQYLLGKLDRAKAQAMLDRARTQPWFKLIYLRDTLPDPANATRKSELAFEPVTILDHVRQPTLLIFGDADPWIPVAQSLNALQTAKHANIEAHVINGADHTMMTSLSQKDQMDPALMPKAKPEATGYFTLLAQWLTRRGFIVEPRP